MPDSSNQSLVEGRDVPNAFQHVLDRFERDELKLLADDRKDREQRMMERFATARLELTPQK
ncbi:hypothetical protein FNL55_03025 [Tardiphaga sp. vice352]|uniref:hypothetical protein n=1 Tax=unclassified Tardiphaga TaxID=2631404 RepID=UPI001161CFB3|nr:MULTISPECIES: hypothetical protein [unclassified Tardiphaga]QDM15040.1 hypothetical protein FNL53_03020 [Tardiphaga sp. vice278]QDM20150.1 hypothetical protein FIU28_02490 [Tardiphaga sp. vice154]QDM25221.1 hypothetical protein FNL56_02930 [Tardiphaga sp. vice304]QDM30432.1 hypothetical protein FNL55_03025 [Tardiphaga sp. vice352]